MDLGFDPEELKKEMKQVKMEVEEATRGLNKSAPIPPQPRSKPPPGGPGGGGGGGGRPRRNVSNTFNIIGGTINHASIANQGPVTFNKKQEVYQKGANRENIKISGGNFSQANIGGKANYNNLNCEVSAGGAGITLEKLLAYIIGKGVTDEDLIKLLEKNYSLTSIAFSLPDDATKTSRAVNALLA